MYLKNIYTYTFRNAISVCLTPLWFFLLPPFTLNREKCCPYDMGPGWLFGRANFGRSSAVVRRGGRPG